MLKIKFAVGLRLKKELKNDIYIEKKKDKTHWIVRHETDNYEKLKKNTHTHTLSAQFFASNLRKIIETTNHKSKAPACKYQVIKINEAKN